MITPILLDTRGGEKVQKKNISGRTRTGNLLITGLLSQVEVRRANHCTTKTSTSHPFRFCLYQANDKLNQSSLTLLPSFEVLTFFVTTYCSPPTLAVGRRKLDASQKGPFENGLKCSEVDNAPVSCQTTLPSPGKLLTRLL